jgi:PAS domain-containing protein
MSDRESRTAHRERVYEAFADRSLPVGEAVEAALSAGTDRLGVEIGFLTRIEDGTQYIEQAVGDHDVIQPGYACPLDEAYCRRTVALDGQLSVQDARTATEISEAAYEHLQLGSYIGCKVVVDDEVYGTVCFADEATRESPFSEAEELFVELVARLVGRAIERREYEQRQAERTEQFRAEKRRFEAISENTFDIIYRLDSDGEFTFVSGAIERVLGYTPESVIGDNCVLVNNAALAGHVVVGDWAILSGYALVHQFCRIGAHSFAGFACGISKDVPAYVTVSGHPAEAKTINVEGLKRRGFSREAIVAIRRAYKIIYRQGLTLEEAIAELTPMAAEQPELELLLDSLKQSERGIVR